MDVDARKKFRNVLLKAKGDESIEKIKSVLTYPDKIYRYRSVDVRTLNALAENKLYFSTSNYYDDPFDTYFHINKENIYTEDLKDLRNDMRKCFKSICFAEESDNESLWLKYANNHSGFVLEYDVKNLCNKSSDCESDEYKKIAHFYPVIYTNSVYNATEFAVFILDSFSLTDEELNNKILDSDFDVWEMLRILLMKRKAHADDNEWRLFGSSGSSISYVEIQPTKIILGLKISADDKKAVLRAAENAGIENIEQMTINDNDEFVAEPIK